MTCANSRRSLPKMMGGYAVVAEALKQRIAELLVECKGNPFLGEPMGPGLHPELANCRRVRFDIPSYAREASLPPDLPQ